MEITAIPFVSKVGIRKNASGCLDLPFDESVHNYLGSVHASALFALAETASGEALQQAFPELVGKVVPVVRDSRTRFRKPATRIVTAYPSVSQQSAVAFKQQFVKKGRSSISVEVEVRDSEGTIVLAGTFNWFVQGIEQRKTAENE